MEDKIHDLIRERLFGGNLRKLIPLCRESVFKQPAIYGSLVFVLSALLEEYDNQAVHEERYADVINSLQDSILLLLQEDADNPGAVFSRLNDVFLAYRSLQI